MGLTSSTEQGVSDQGKSKKSPPLRIMMVGDSMTHGQEGDWTWRYRFWQWLWDHQKNNSFDSDKNAQVSFELVGPWTGTQAHVMPGEEVPPGPRATGGYARDVDKQFSGHHFAAWGRAVAQDRDLIENEVREHRPDLLLVMLGFNDLGWFISDARGTLESMKIFVASARRANPNIKFALANIPQRTLMGGRDDLVTKTTEYNSLLEESVPTWSIDCSPVRLVRLQETYQCAPEGCPAGYDGLHPNALGDYQIARAFSETCVKDFKIGRTILQIPSHIPSRYIAVPKNVKAYSRPARVKMTWDRVYGAYGYDVQHRTPGMEGWHLNLHMDERHDVLFLTAGDLVELRVRMTCGDELCSDWSEIVSATAL